MIKRRYQVTDIVESLTLRAVVALLVTVCNWQLVQSDPCSGWIPTCQESASATGLSALGWVFLGLALLYGIRAGQLYVRHWKHRHGG